MLLRTNRFDESRVVECNDCTWSGLELDLLVTLDEVPNLFERISPGETVPAGECPSCGALAAVAELRPEAHAYAREAVVLTRIRAGEIDRRAITLMRLSDGRFAVVANRGNSHGVFDCNTADTLDAAQQDYRGQLARMLAFAVEG